MLRVQREVPLRASSAVTLSPPAMKTAGVPLAAQPTETAAGGGLVRNVAGADQAAAPSVSRSAAMALGPVADRPRSGEGPRPTKSSPSSGETAAVARLSSPAGRGIGAGQTFAPLVTFTAYMPTPNPPGPRAPM